VSLIHIHVLTQWPNSNLAGLYNVASLSGKTSGP